ncbi:unnamed protein product [Thlaspi arvense]|uniref:Uncharacterized protein n=1 Tax=Thlaspi arvense TaxID=13288 RepID=A0AAU9SGB1_THLAR|nr:unnamed protein product [Thlaspi arvense]
MIVDRQCSSSVPQIYRLQYTDGGEECKITGGGEAWMDDGGKAWMEDGGEEWSSRGGLADAGNRFRSGRR